MTDATYLLLINCVTGLTFACAYLGTAWRSSVRLGRWCAAAFLSAASATIVEAAVPLLPSVRLASTLSFGLLMMALTLIASGLLRHYRPRASLSGAFLVALGAVVFTAVVGVGLPRGTWAQSLTYQLPFAAMLAIACGIVLRFSARRPVDLVLSAILAVCALQFAAKAVLIPLGGADIGVRDYLTSTYARYSQTAGSILAVMLGVGLLAVIVADVIAEATGRLARDGLSGALTRTAFIERAGAMLDLAPGHGRPGVLMCDLDHFKSINDQFGHAAGDEVIRRFGEILLGCVGSGGLCGRVGGEEFCLLLPAADAATLERLAFEVRKATGAISFPWLPASRRITASLGGALVVPGETLASAMGRADMALYRVKAGGRDGFRLAPDR